MVLATGMAVQAEAQPGEDLMIAEQNAGNAFQLFNTASVASFNIDAQDAKVVAVSAEAFIKDMELVSGKKMQLNTGSSSGAWQIVAGTMRQSGLIDSFIKTANVDVSAIQGKWECFLIQVVGPNKLMIAGSDPRGTAFGIFHLSKLMGVSPFVWWADVMPQQKQQLFVSGSYTSTEPSVKYRGIFLNDEDWGLQPWAAKTFEPETGDIGPKTYAKVFELLLRLKANLIWPAMHEVTRSFFTIPGNSKVAEDYGIIIGSSHAEPMLRSNTGEWDVKTKGNFNYIANKDSVYKYWEDRVIESKGINAMYSMGMRGVHDSKMEGIKDAKEAVPLLETIFKDQRDLLSKHINKDVTKVPQVFTAYKEVLEIYDLGLKVPEDITLVWPDDNYGYIQRLNNETEKQRQGGSGVYYHASYWGRPHDYLWLSTAHPALVQEEMMKAYSNGSNRLWVVNVGDIKPLEYITEMFLDMAYHAEPFNNNGYAKQHLHQWLSFIFGREKASSMHGMLWEYYNLAFERKPEYMGWSQTEPTTQTNYTGFNHFFYGDEAQKRLERYQAIELQAKNMRKQIASNDQAAFYQLVYYPVVSASYMNRKFIYRDKSHYYGLQNRLSAKDYANKSVAMYDSILLETEYYNLKLSAGKWNQMMSMAPRKLPVFLPPVLPAINPSHTGGWGLAPEGLDLGDSSSPANPGKTLSLPQFDNLNGQQYFIDIFLKDSTAVPWTATTSVPWIKLSATKGTLLPKAGSNETRLMVSVDWNKAPVNQTQEAQIIFSGNGKQQGVKVVAKKPPGLPMTSADYFIENNGYVSMHAGHYTNIQQGKLGGWNVLPGLGYAGESLQSKAVSIEDTLHLTDTAWIRRNASFAEYDFFTFTEAPAALTVFTLPTHPLHGAFSMRYAVSVDNGPIQIVDFKTFGRSEEWKQNVLKNRASKTIQLANLPKGAHILKVYSIDPGVILDAMLIDLGGLNPANGLIPETRVAKP